MKFENQSNLSRDEIVSRLKGGNIPEIIEAVLSAALNDSDWKWAQNICASQTDHADIGVRGIAILGLGHIARIHRNLDKSSAITAILNGLADPNAFIRGQSEATKDDVELYMKWKIE